MLVVCTYLILGGTSPRYLRSLQLLTTQLILKELSLSDIVMHKH